MGFAQWVESVAGALVSRLEAQSWETRNGSTLALNHFGLCCGSDDIEIRQMIDVVNRHLPTRQYSR
eukprot:2724083-Amphidinium_carterae.2